jgi:predicted GIY-YIG superfamily endonuclease
MCHLDLTEIVLHATKSRIIPHPASSILQRATTHDNNTTNTPTTMTKPHTDTADNTSTTTTITTTTTTTTTTASCTTTTTTTTEPTGTTYKTIFNWTRYNYKGPLYHDNRRLLEHRERNCECFTCAREMAKLPPQQTQAEYIASCRFEEREIKRAKKKAKKEVKKGKQATIKKFFR